MTPEEESIIDKIAIYFAMEHEIDAVITRDYCIMLCSTDLGSLDSAMVLFSNNSARKAFINACRDKRAQNTAFGPVTQGVTQGPMMMQASTGSGDSSWLRRPDKEFVDYHNILRKELKRERLIR